MKREKIIQQLSHLSICVSPGTTLSALDKIRLDFDSAAVRLKQNMEHSLQSASLVQTVESHDLSVALSISVPNIDDELVQMMIRQTLVMTPVMVILKCTHISHRINHLRI